MRGDGMDVILGEGTGMEGKVEGGEDYLYP